MAETGIENEAAKSPKNGGVAKIVIIVIVVCALVGLGIFAFQQMQLQNAKQQANTSAPAIEKDAAPLAANPIDFATLQQQNPDIYAWLYIPGTNINFPVLQHPLNDFFYLHHDTNGQPTTEGSIYTEMQTSKDFTDPVSVIYGHNIAEGLMFHALHNFSDPQFFAATPEFYIYTPGHILTYAVVAATPTDDSHILNTHNFKDQEQLLAYFKQVQNPTREASNARADITLSADSKVVQLATCSNTNDNERFVVTGVLVSDTPTA